MKRAIAMAVAVASLCASCMTDREAWLRGKDIDAKAAHKETYEPLIIKGGMTLSDDAELVVTVPSQPYVHTPIPDGAAIQAGVIKDITTTAGLVTLGVVGAANAGDSTKTTINTVPAEGGK